MLTEEDLTSIEAKVLNASCGVGLVEDLLDEMVNQDIPALIATCRELLPLSDALASGEADQYKRGWNAATDKATEVVERWALGNDTRTDPGGNARTLREALNSGKITP